MRKSILDGLIKDKGGSGNEGYTNIEQTEYKGYIIRTVKESDLSGEWYSHNIEKPDGEIIDHHDEDAASSHEEALANAKQRIDKVSKSFRERWGY